jgi:hypothetical protein
MPLIVCHAPSGGVGTTFLAAHLALGLAARGHDVTAIDFTHADALKTFFGLPPAHDVPAMGGPPGSGLIVDGVELLSGWELGQDANFLRLLTQPGGSPFDDSRIVIADISSADLRIKNALLPHAALHLCALMPRPASLAALAKIQPGTPTIELQRTAFVLNQADDTLKLSRHSQIFLCDLFGENLIATIRRDEAVNEALASFKSVARYAPQSVVLPELANLALAVETRCGLSTHAAQRA